MKEKFGGENYFLILSSVHGKRNLFPPILNSYLWCESVLVLNVRQMENPFRKYQQETQNDLKLNCSNKKQNSLLDAKKSTGSQQFICLLCLLFKIGKMGPPHPSLPQYKNRYKARNVLNCHASGGSPSFITSSELRHNGVIFATHTHPSV